MHAIVPAGGAGTRLWPLSRRSHPKFLMDLTGSGKTLLQATVLRLAPCSESVTVVTGTAHATSVRAQLESLVEGGLVPAGLPLSVVAEPSGRDSMAAIGLGAYLLGEKYGSSAIIGSFAADHLIQGEAAFHQAVLEAAGAAAEGFVATVGLRPTWPSTAYGYIQVGDEPASPGALIAERFVEKPDARTAESYVELGFLWNAGMFVMKVSTLREHLKALHPTIDHHLSRIAGSWQDADRRGVLETEWPRIKRIAFDNAIAEPVAAEGGVATATMEESGWSDVGDWADLGPFMPADQSAAHVLLDSEGAVVRVDPAKALAVIGVPDAVVIDTPDALLVTTRANSQRVKQAVDELAGRATQGFAPEQYL